MITNLATGRRYVGKKKLSRRITRPPLKGAKKKRRETRPSDYPTYWGSCNELLDEIDRDGTAGYSREIIRLCSSTGEASYYEAKVQFEEDVLLKPDEWYNSAIMVRVHRSHVVRKK